MKSRSLHPSALALLTLVTPTSALVSEIDPSIRQGPTSNMAFGLSLRTTSPETTLVKAPQKQTTAPAVWSQTQFPNSPDFAAAAMFPGLSSLVRIDAHSTGNDVIPDLDSNGIPLLTTNANWLGVVVSVKSGETGETGSLINRAKLSGRTSGADLFSYYFSESTGIASSLAGKTFVSQTREAMGLGGSSTDDIDALDFGLGVRSYSQATPPSILFTNGDEYYFSITPDSALMLNGQTNFMFALDASATLVPAHAAAVYKIEYASGAWGPIHVHRSQIELGLTNTGDDIDGLAVDPTSHLIVFSTQPVAGRSQLQVYHRIDGLHPLREGNGTLATEHLGGIDDVTDIDSICILDPTEYVGLPSHFGTPVENFPLGGPSMGLSVTRSQDHTPNAPSMLHCQLSGRNGDAIVESNVVFYRSTDYDPGRGWANATWVALNAANPIDMYRKDRGTEIDNVFDFSMPSSNGGGPHTEAIVALSFDMNDNLIGGSWIVVIQAP